ncbi:MAG: alpha/beta hydrolase-fold protein [Mariniphaga sp.]|nr:alpha/beta hydrolase-fold protein [Mariniphaga sp.]MDD4226790.1 alpha/beta hydrolase-fold protein [Mariniphaga sp.]MDD4424947.1 alpha/beta hydrolase-fold protein [Mariniphaga sp.]
MKKIILTISACFFLVFHQESAAQLMREPEIDDQNRATFTVNAPNAKEVKVINQSDEMAMGAAEYSLTRGENGIWTVTTKPCRPGLHYYKLSIDGFECADPQSQMYFGWARWSSCLEVPDKNISFYLPKNNPTGDVIIHWYHSKVTGNTRKCLIYTPPGYRHEMNKRYPVLYLQHGSGESELGWTMQGKVNFIMDNLIAEGKAVPMIIVMDNGYAPAPDAEDKNRPAGNSNKFEELVLQDLIPEIDANYRTLSARESRAIAGLSMGAGQAQRIGFGNLDVFASIGAFSGGSRNFDPNTSYSGVFKDAKKFNETVKLYWFGCGTLDRAYEGARSLHNELSKHGIQHVWHEMHGSHEWQVWRHHIHEFAQQLFK